MIATYRVEISYGPRTVANRWRAAIWPAKVADEGHSWPLAVLPAPSADVALELAQQWVRSESGLQQGSRTVWLSAEGDLADDPHGHSVRA